MNDNQYIKITAYQCQVCGRVLKTERGLIRHNERCKFIAPPIKGQVGMFKVSQQCADVTVEEDANYEHINHTT